MKLHFFVYVLYDCMFLKCYLYCLLSNIDTINNFYDLSFPFRVEVPLEHLANPIQDIKEENDLDVPLPTDQVRYLCKLKPILVLT